MSFNLYTMINNLRTSFFTILLALFLIAPSYALAQLPPETRSHPTATPPTKAPTKALAPAPLPNGQMTLSPATTSAGESTTTSTGSSAASPPSLGSTSLYLLTGLGILLLVGIGWFVLRRRGVATQTEI